MTSTNFDEPLPSPSQHLSDSLVGCHQQYRVINFREDGIRLWNGSQKLKEQYEPLSNRIQSIITEDDKTERVVTSIHVSETIIHIIVNYELKQIIKCRKPNISILCHHIYLRKKKKISIVIGCSDENVYLFEILKKEKKRKSKKETTKRQEQHSQIPSKFKRISKEKIVPVDLDWKDEIVNNHGIIVKEFDDSDILANVSNFGVVSQIQSVEPESLKSLISDESKRPSSGKHILLISRDQILKLYQEEDAEELTIIPQTKLPSVASCRMNALYYCEDKVNQIIFDQNSFILDEELFKCLFGRDYVFLTASICLVGCEDGSVFCFPSNHNIIQRFSHSTCYRKITQMRNPVQNIIPMIISTDSSMKKFNSILMVGRFGHVVLLYHDSERIIHRSWYIDQIIASSIVQKEQLIFSNESGSMFSLNIFSKITDMENPFSFSKNSKLIKIPERVQLREIITTGDIQLIHELKNQKICQNPNTNLEVSLSQLSFTSDQRQATFSSKPKGMCTVLTREGLLHHLAIPPHDLIDESVSKTAILNRLQTGVRDMIVKLDENQTKLQTLSNREKELNQEIYSLNIAMHLLNEWKDQGKKLIPAAECKICKENLEAILECSLLNGSRFVLTHQWTIIIILEQDGSPSKCLSFPIMYLGPGNTWNRNISLLNCINDLNYSFRITFLLTFSYAESQFSLEIKRQEFNLMDLVQTSTPQYAIMKRNLGLISMKSPKQRIKSLMNRGLSHNFSHLSIHSSVMTHGFKLRFNPLEEVFIKNWQTILQIPLQQDLPKDVLDREIVSLSSNNFSTPTSLITPYGQELKLKISPSTQIMHSFEVLIQGTDFHSLLFARHSILAKFQHFLSYRNELLHSNVYPRLSSKEELVDLIKVMQNFGDQIQHIQTTLEQLEHHTTHIQSSNKILKNLNQESEMTTMQPLSNLLSKIISFDKAVIELFREMRQTKCGI